MRLAKQRRQTAVYEYSRRSKSSCEGERSLELLIGKVGERRSLFSKPINKFFTLI